MGSGETSVPFSAVGNITSHSKNADDFTCIVSERNSDFEKGYRDIIDSDRMLFLYCYSSQDTLVRVSEVGGIFFTEQVIIC